MSQTLLFRKSRGFNRIVYVQVLCYTAYGMLGLAYMINFLCDKMLDSRDVELLHEQ